MATAHVKHHDYHLVDPSPWPIVGSISAFVMAVGAISWMHHLYSAAPIVSPPALERPNGSPRGPPRPLTIDPATVTTAILGRFLRPGTDGIGTGDPLLPAWA